jgi:adenosylcobinamide-GDP ribazoletransferase
MPSIEPFISVGFMRSWRFVRISCPELKIAIHALVTMPAAIVPLVLLAGHSLSRLSPLLLMRAYTYARDQPRKASEAVYQPDPKELAFATVIALLPLTLLPVLCVLTIIPILLITVLLGRHFYRHIGGYTGDCLGASQQVTKTVFYLSVSALWIFI